MSRNVGVDAGGVWQVFGSEGKSPVGEMTWMSRGVGPGAGGLMASVSWERRSLPDSRCCSGRVAALRIPQVVQQRGSVAKVQ